MYEFEKYEYEFSKIYKRLLRLEMLMKRKLINSALSVYKDDVMVVFSKFFNNRHIFDTYTAKKTMIQEQFYAVKSLNFKELKNAKNVLIELRNYIAHFNFKEYNMKKSRILKFFDFIRNGIGLFFG